MRSGMHRELVAQSRTTGPLRQPRDLLQAATSAKNTTINEPRSLWRGPTGTRW
jgi:hypothetical protein